MALQKEDVQELSKLCRILCTEDEIDHLTKDLDKILSYIEQLQQVDTTGVRPCNTVLEELCSVFREDQTGKTLERDTFLANAPSKVAGMVKVPPVIKGHTS